MKFNTSLLHGAFRGEPQTGATLTPIYQSSAFEQESAERLEKIFHNQAPGFSYTRINNPTVEAFEKRMTVLEGGKSSVACASGMAAMFSLMHLQTSYRREMRSYRVRASMVEALISSGILKHSESRLIMSKTTISMHSAKRPTHTQDSILQRHLEIRDWM